MSKSFSDFYYDDSIDEAEGNSFRNAAGKVTLGSLAWGATKGLVKGIGKGLKIIKGARGTKQDILAGLKNIFTSDKKFTLNPDKLTVIGRLTYDDYAGVIDRLAGLKRREKRKYYGAEEENEIVEIYDAIPQGSISKINQQLPQVKDLVLVQASVYLTNKEGILSTMVFKSPDDTEYFFIGADKQGNNLFKDTFGQTVKSYSDNSLRREKRGEERGAGRERGKKEENNLNYMLWLEKQKDNNKLPKTKFDTFIFPIRNAAILETQTKKVKMAQLSQKYYNVPKNVSKYVIYQSKDIDYLVGILSVSPKENYGLIAIRNDSNITDKSSRSVNLILKNEFSVDFPQVTGIEQYGDMFNINPYNLPIYDEVPSEDESDSDATKEPVKAEEPKAKEPVKAEVPKAKEPKAKKQAPTTQREINKKDYDELYKLAYPKQPIKTTESNFSSYYFDAIINEKKGEKETKQVIKIGDDWVSKKNKQYVYGKNDQQYFNPEKFNYVAVDEKGEKAGKRIQNELQKQIEKQLKLSKSPEFKIHTHENDKEDSPKEEIKQWDKLRDLIDDSELGGIDDDHDFNFTFKDGGNFYLSHKNDKYNIGYDDKGKRALNSIGFNF